MTMRPYCYLLLAAALWACSSSGADSPPIRSEAFAKIYAELLVLSSADSSENLAEAPRGTAADSVLARAGVTPDEYRETVRWYNEDVTRWRDLLAQVVAHLEQRVQRADSLLKADGNQERGLSSGEAEPKAAKSPR